MNSKIKSDAVHTDIDRRKFIDQAIKGIGAITLGTYTITFLQACSEADSPTAPTGSSGGDGNNPAEITVDLSLPANSALRTVGGTLALSANEIDSQGMLLYRADNATVKVYSRRCTHSGCTTGAFNGGVSECGCHGSQFNLNGDVIQGPASVALKQYTATLAGDILTIK